MFHTGYKDYKENLEGEADYHLVGSWDCNPDHTCRDFLEEAVAEVAVVVGEVVEDNLAVVALHKAGSGLDEAGLAVVHHSVQSVVVDPASDLALAEHQEEIVVDCT